MRHTQTIFSTLGTSTLRFIRGWHLSSVAAFILLASVGFAAVFYGHTAARYRPAPTVAASAAAAPSLGTAESFAVLGGSTVTNTGPTMVTGDLGVWPGTAITGFGPGVVTGVIHANDPVALQAQADLTIAYNSLAGMPCDANLTGQDLGGLTLAPGVYCFNSSAQLTGTLTLDAQGDPEAVFIFQIGSTLTTATGSMVQVINGGQNCNAFWQVGSSATLGTATAFVGDILALASITLTTNTTLSGRALARTGAVTMDTNAVSAAFCTPTLSKAFSPPTINAGGISTLTITLGNPNNTATTLTAPLTDSLPPGVVIAAVPNASNTCGGSVIAVAGTGAVTLTGGVIPAGNSVIPGTCTVTVNVTAALGGTYLNTIPAGALQTNHGNSLTPAIATLAVNSPPTIGKAFSPTTINVGDVSTLTITLSNPNAGPAALIAPLIDALPAGVVVAAVPNISNTCGGVVTAVAGTGTVTLTGGAIPGGAPGTCTVTVNVTAATAGNYVNTIPAGALLTSVGSNIFPAIATLTVVSIDGPPTIAKAFSPATINAGGVSTLTITLINPSAGAATLIAPFIDTLPAGVVIAAVPNASNTCGGAVTAIAGGGTVTLTGGAIPGGAPGVCTVMVNVTAAAAGNYINTIPAGALQTSRGNNSSPAIATLTVVCPLPVTTITTPNAVCALLAGNVASVPDAGVGATYTWTITGGTINSGQGTSSIMFTAGTISPLTLNVLVTTQFGCTANGSRIVTINPLPVTAITGPLPIVCPLSTGNTASVPDAGPGATYSWTIAGGTITSGQGTRSITFTAGNVGPVVLNVTVTTAAGCTASSTFTIAVSADCGVDVCVVKTGSSPVAYENSQFTYTLSIVNFGPGAATGVTVTDTLPAGVTLVSATPSQGTCSGTSTITCNLGNLAAQATATIRLVVLLPMKFAGTLLCNTAVISSEQLEIVPANNVSTLCVPVEKIPPGPGPNLPPASQISDQKSGSVLIFPYYTSDAASPNLTNTRINITNVENQWSACVHLFFIDGASCSVADTYVCLTPNQTASFLMFDLDPGTTGYVVAVQVDCLTGCPLNINTLIGDEYVKMASGHAANLAAEAISGLPGVRALCDANSSIAEMRFDGVMYNQLPRVLALDSIASRADGNDTLLIINRIGGNLGTGAATLGTLFGILYDDTERALSFQISGGCQLRGSLSNNFPRTAPRFETFIPSGRTGWLKIFSQFDIGILGAAINFNPNVGASAGAFNQGHNLHKLTLTATPSLTIPVFPPFC